MKRMQLQQGPGEQLYRQGGFTITELMIVLGIAGIMLAIGLPSFRQLIQNMRIEADTNEFISTLQNARAEAIARGRDVVVTASAPPSASNEWGSNDITVERMQDDGVTVDLEVGFLNALQTNLDSDGDLSTFTFSPMGMTTADDIYVCDDRSDETGRHIKILASGVIRADTVDCASL